MRLVCCPLLLTLVFGLVATPVSAQSRTIPSESRILSSAQRALARELAMQPSSPPARRDSVANGTAIGAAIGGATAFTLISVMYARCDGCDAPAFKELGVPVTLLGTGVGALVGYLIDRAR